MFENFAQNMQNAFSGDAGKERLYGIGLLASQLGAGQTPNAGPALKMLQERQQRNALKEQMGNDEFLSQFSDSEKAFLATLPPAAAQELIAQRIFAAPAPAPEPIEVNDQLVNPVTGEVLGDYRTPEAASAPGRRVVDGRLIDEQTGAVIADYREDDPQEVSYIASGSAAEALGLSPDGAYNITSGPGGMSAQAIGGGPLVSIDQSQGEVGTIPTGYELFTNPDGSRQLRPIPGGPEDTSAKVASSDATIQDSIRLIDDVANDPALAGITGMVQGNMPPLTQGGTDLNVKIDQIKGQAFLSAFEQLKGGGTITEREGAAATDAIARLNRAQSTEAFQVALADLRYVLERGLSREGNPNAALPDFSLPSQSTATRLRYNPETGEFE